MINRKVWLYDRDGKDARISDLVRCESVECCIHPDGHKGIHLQSFHQRWCSGTDKEGIW